MVATSAEGHAGHGGGGRGFEARARVLKLAYFLRKQCGEARVREVSRGEKVLLFTSVVGDMHTHMHT